MTTANIAQAVHLTRHSITTGWASGLIYHAYPNNMTIGICDKESAAKNFGVWLTDNLDVRVVSPCLIEAVYICIGWQHDADFRVSRYRIDAFGFSPPVQMANSASPLAGNVT
ncbi:MAG: hypothetical protein ACYCYL_07715 [Acidithiobacillus sp.]